LLVRIEKGRKYIKITFARTFEIIDIIVKIRNARILAMMFSVFQSVDVKRKPAALITMALPCYIMVSLLFSPHARVVDDTIPILVLVSQKVDYIIKGKNIVRWQQVIKSTVVVFNRPRP
jgi:hypothetical protein